MSNDEGPVGVAFVSPFDAILRYSFRLVFCVSRWRCSSEIPLLGVYIGSYRRAKKILIYTAVGGNRSDVRFDVRVSCM